MKPFKQLPKLSPGSTYEFGFPEESILEFVVLNSLNLKHFARDPIKIHIEGKGCNYYHGRFKDSAIGRCNPAGSLSLHFGKSLTIFLLGKSISPYLRGIEKNRLHCTH